MARSKKKKAAKKLRRRLRRQLEALQSTFARVATELVIDVAAQLVAKGERYLDERSRTATSQTERTQPDRPVEAHPRLDERLAERERVRLHARESDEEDERDDERDGEREHRLPRTADHH